MRDKFESSHDLKDLRPIYILDAGGDWGDNQRAVCIALPSG